jgi:hypothetical protein
LTPAAASVILGNTQFEDLAMSKRFFPVFCLCVACLFALDPVHAQDVKSGPQKDERLPGSFQPLNLNGEFKGSQHCLVCQFRINPVALVFVKQAGTTVDPEVKKLIDALESASKEYFADYGMSSFVVFLTPSARSSVTEGKGGKDTDLVEEAKLREKLIVNLEKQAADYKNVIWTTFPADAPVDDRGTTLASKYRLSDKADVTVILYARHFVMDNFAFGEGQLKEAGVEKVRDGIRAMLDRVKKGFGSEKKGDAGQS